VKGFLQIHDPLKPKGQVVGIDLGTTNSLVASVIQGQPRCLPVDATDELLLPSVVHYAADGRWAWGGWPSSSWRTTPLTSSSRSNGSWASLPVTSRRRSSAPTASPMARAWCASR
jgi:molecular chaperone DnaK (HSP70)